MGRNISHLYSYLNAPTGFNFDALLAGKNHAAAPTSKENKRQPIIKLIG